jgi:hypothetical protein
VSQAGLLSRCGRRLPEFTSCAGIGRRPEHRTAPPASLRFLFGADCGVLTMVGFNGVWGMDASYWPRDTKEHVFLARALGRVGEALYNEEWTGEEPRTEVVEPLPPDPKGARDYLKVRAQSYLERNHPRLAQPRRELKLVRLPTEFSFSPEGWEAASEYFNERHREAEAAIQRFGCAVRKMLDALADGSLKSALRPLSGSAIGEVLPESHWHMEQGRHRLLTCSISEAQPFASGKATHWIFVTAESLADFIRELNKGGSGTNRDVTRCKRWLTNWMLEHPEHRPLLPDGSMLTKEVICEMAYERFGVNPNQFNTIWAEIHRLHPEVKWRSGGRPKGSTKSS